MVLDTEPDAEEKAKLLLLGKLFSIKTFSRLVVKDIISKAWNTVNEVEVFVVDKNIFLSSFKHEVDVRRVWEVILGNFCYGCGLLGHDVKSCLDAEVQSLWKKGTTFGIHENWLRAEVSEFQSGRNLEGLRSVDMIECDQRAVKVSGVANILESQAGPSQPSEDKAVQLVLDN